MYLKTLIKYIFAFTLLIIFIYAFSDSYKSHNIDNLAYVLAMGIDSTDSDKIKVTFQFTKNSSFSESSSSDTSDTVVDSVEASSIDDAINLINSYIGKELNLAHCKAVVFSENMAQNGIRKEVYTLINNAQLRPTTNIIISKIDAESYIENSSSSFETIITKYYDIFPNSSDYTGYTSNTTLGYFFNNMYDSNYNPTAILGGINDDSSDNNSSTGEDFDITSNNSTIIGEKETENIGLAVFKGDVLVGELTAIETLCHSIIQNDVSSFVLSIPDPKSTGKNIDISATIQKDTKVNIDISGSSPYITINIYLSARILTVDENTDFLDEDYIKSVSESANKYLESTVSDYLYKTSTEFNSDIDKFSKYVVSKFLTTEDWNSYNWESNYQNSIFKVNVDTNVTSSLLLTES